MSPIGNITSRIYSTLGSDNSLVPLFIKDTANSMGLTAGAYVTGDKLESKNRFIDEFGTQAIWILGIPVYKKAIDLTLYKAFGIDHKFDVRNFKNKEILEKSKEYAKEILPKLNKSIEKASKLKNTTKALSMTKFAAATLLTIGSYLGLTNYRQNLIKEDAKKEILEKYNGHNKPSMDAFVKNPDQKPSFEAFFNGKKHNKQPSFTGLQDFIFNPVKNLMIVDAAISGQRIIKSTDNQDRLGFIIKEGGFWAFMYLAKKPIQEFLERKVAVKHELPINLDSTVIESDRLKSTLNTKKMLTDLEAFAKKKTDIEIYDFILNKDNKNNIVIEMAEKCDVIPTIKQNWVQKLLGKTPDGHREIDVRKYIDIEEVKNIKNKLEALNNACEKHVNAAKDKDKAFEQFMQKIKTLKRTSTFKNMAICIGALGVAVPAIMVALRYLKKDNLEFKVKEDLEKQMIANGEISQT